MMTEKVDVVVDETKKVTDMVVKFGRESFYMGLGVVSVVQELSLIHI